MTGAVVGAFLITVMCSFFKSVVSTVGSTSFIGTKSPDEGSSTNSTVWLLPEFGIVILGLFGSTKFVPTLHLSIFIFFGSSKLSVQNYKLSIIFTPVINLFGSKLSNLSSTGISAIRAAQSNKLPSGCGFSSIKILSS